MKKNKVTLISLSIFLLAVCLNIFLDSYSIPKRFTRIDQSQHFYDMKKWYESGKLPVTSARFIASQVVNEELTTPRVPGGAYYIFYTLFYKMGHESLFAARVINLIFNLIIISIFLFWVFKKFGFFIMSIMSSFILCNGYFIAAIGDFWNPNLTLIFSFILFILLYEYSGSNNENIIKASAVFIFPVLAIMAQGHFVTFFSMIPTLIIYLIIRHKKTFKYFIYWTLGVFISFLEYLPYLISEMKNGFSNTNLIFSVRSQLSSIALPQMHALTLFPTNEMSVFYGNSIYGTLNFWFSNPPYIFGFIFLLLSVIFSFFCFIRALYFVFNKKYTPRLETEKIILELLRIFFLFIPVTILVNMLARSKPGTFHYLYSAFSLSFLPIMLFFIQKEDKIKVNNKFFYVISMLLILNLLSMTGQLTRYFKNYEEPRNPEGMKTVANAFVNNTNAVSIIGVYADDNYMYRDIAVAYFPELVWKQDNNKSNTNIYVVLDRIGTLSRTKKSVDEYMQYLSTNAVPLTNNGTLFVYKYIGQEPLVMPKKR